LRKSYRICYDAVFLTLVLVEQSKSSLVKVFNFICLIFNFSTLLPFLFGILSFLKSVIVLFWCCFILLFRFFVLLLLFFTILKEDFVILTYDALQRPVCLVTVRLGLNAVITKASIFQFFFDSIVKGRYRRLGQLLRYWSTVYPLTVNIEIVNIRVLTTGLQATSTLMRV